MYTTLLVDRRANSDHAAAAGGRRWPRRWKVSPALGSQVITTPVRCDSTADVPLTRKYQPV